jgi:hypothetical protein
VGVGGDVRMRGRGRNGGELRVYMGMDVGKKERG